MIRRVRLAALAVLLVVAAAQGASPAGAASRPANPGALHASRPAATAPLSWGNIEFRGAAGAVTTWSGATSSTGGSSTVLDARIPSPSDPTQSFRLTMAMGFSVPITPGTYTPGFHGLNPAWLTQDQTTVCGFNGTGTIRVDQYVVDGTGAVTAYAVAFQCPSIGSVPGTWSGSLAYNVRPSTPGQGYYLYRQNGALDPFGNDGYLSYLGDLSEHPLNRPVVGMATTADGGGYWLVASDGGIFAFGDAAFLGSMGGLALNRPIVGMAAAPPGGYWLVASDGGIFAFDAPFWGSTGALRLNRPVVGMAPTPDGRGYWLVAADGGIFTFGTAQFHGSTGGLALYVTMVGMHQTADGSGYWLAATDGGVAAFGAPDYSGAGYHGPADVAGITG